MINLDKKPGLKTEMKTKRIKQKPASFKKGNKVASIPIIEKTKLVQSITHSAIKNGSVLP